MKTGQATLNSDTPTAIVALTDRRNVVILCSTDDCYVGAADVTAATGLLVKAGTPYPLMPGDPAYSASQGTLYGITPTGAATASYLEMSNN